MTGQDNWKLDYPSSYDSEDAPRYCECGNEIYDEYATDCDDCLEFICDECGEYNEKVVRVAPHEKYCQKCFEAAEEVKAATLAELTELGFTNIPKATSDETWVARCEQVDDGKIDGAKLLDAVSEEFPSEVCKENYLNLELAWLENQVDRLHGEG